ncbi:MAG: UvrD-helicase domain-containing protein [Treponemataceae bacterium]|nr:UvrD-helicase domain-containing protein [Treponemataceae bacterium]
MSEKEKRIDIDQMAAIKARLNSVVSAGAGSGKTTVLSERFLNLIQENGYSADKILTLTFTKKATVEMSSRIYKVLKRSAPEQAALFNKANIKTLDAYCNYVAKLGAHFYGISPDFKTDKSLLREEIEAVSLPFILKYRDNPGIKYLAGTSPLDDLCSELFVEPMLNYSNIAEPIDFESCVNRQVDEVLEEWASCSHKMENALQSFIRAVNQFEGNKAAATFKKLETAAELAEGMEIPLLTRKDIESGDVSPIEEYIKGLLAGFTFRKPGNMKNAEEICEILDEIKKLLEILPSLYDYISTFYIIKSLIPLYVEFQDMVCDIKRSSGILGFSDISNMALCVLRDYPEIRLVEKRKYKAIMIDEFQDNNSDQRDMLYLLAEREDRMERSIPRVSELCPDKLFFVGDEKQSIYGFRGADVSVFRNLSSQFQDGNLFMYTNYRSHPALIAAFNTIFGGAEYPVSGKPATVDALPSVFFSDVKSAIPATNVPPYEAVYHNALVPASKIKEIDTKEKLSEAYQPHVHFAFQKKVDNKDNKMDEKAFMLDAEAVAEWVARKIEELMKRPEDPVNPSDIAILLPKIKSQMLFERTFLRHGIPYNTEVAVDVFSDGPFTDMTAYINLCVNPEDKSSYAQVLRSPFVNLSLMDMEKILALHGVFPDQDFSFLGQSRERFQAAAAFYRRIAESCLYEPLTKTVSRLWYDSGYRYETMWNHSVEMFSKQYDLIFELARQGENNNMNIAAFADCLNQYKEKDSRLEDMDIPLEQSDGVKIMTIHKSKGLEFDVVFLCDSESGGVYEKDDKIRFSKEYALTVKASSSGKEGDSKNYFFIKVKQEKINKKNAELRREAYVALTRAKKELFITHGKYSSKGYEDDYSKYCPGTKKQMTAVFEPLSYIFSFYMEAQGELLLPASGNCAPFDVEEIPFYPRKEQLDRSGRKNTLQDKGRLVEYLWNVRPYDKAELIKLELPERKYTNPSHLHESDDETLRADKKENSFSLEIDKSLPYWEIGEIVLSTLPAKADNGETPEPKFSFANFGTIAHAYMEAAITGKEPVISEREWAGLENRKKAIETVKSICGEMAAVFGKSELGSEVAACMASKRFIKAEYSFRSRLSKSILKGTIDLVFENPDGSFTIVDYKTNQSIKPELYYLQLASYRQAVAAMLGVKDVSSIRCLLYYLRFGKTVDITEKCGEYIA